MVSNVADLQQANKILRYLQAHPNVGILYQKLQGPLRMVVVADSAYKTTDDEVGCLALKGYLIMLVGSNETESVFPGGKCCVMEWVSLTQSNYRAFSSTGRGYNFYRFRVCQRRAHLKARWSRRAHGPPKSISTFR